jgi:hypothetical protein
VAGAPPRAGHHRHDRFGRSHPHCDPSSWARITPARAGPDGWLAARFATALAGFGVAMFTFDAMAFTQVTFVFRIVVALAAVLLLANSAEKRV